MAAKFKKHYIALGYDNLDNEWYCSDPHTTKKAAADSLCSVELRFYLEIDLPMVENDINAPTYKVKLPNNGTGNTS